MVYVYTATIEEAVVIPIYREPKDVVSPVFNLILSSDSNSLDIKLPALTFSNRTYEMKANFDFNGVLPGQYYYTLTQKNYGELGRGVLQFINSSTPNTSYTLDEEIIVYEHN